VNYVIFSWRRVNVFLRDISLERRLASLKVASVVLGSDECEDDDVYGHTSNEDTLDQGVVWHVFYPVCSFDRRAGVLSDS